MVDKIQIEKDKKNWVKNLDDALNNMNAHFAHWTDWTNDGVVLLNGFTNVRPEDPNMCLRTRNLVRDNGDIIASDVAGTIYKNGWNGEEADAFQFSSDMFMSRPEVIGLTAGVASGSDLQAVAKINVGGKPGQWKFSLSAHHIDGQTGDIGGWLALRFLTC